MLLGLWLSRNLYQVRGVMVTGASLLLALSVYLTIDFIQQRHGGNTDPMLYTYSVAWF
jgi:NADH-quinone oxidoreductase subunit M